MFIKIDADVQRVCEFMQRDISAHRLKAVADGVACLAPLLWGHYQAEVVAVLQLRELPISARGPRIRPDATESHPGLVHVDDDSEVAVGSVPLR